jgi:hypothetical protein
MRQALHVSVDKIIAEPTSDAAPGTVPALLHHLESLLETFGRDSENPDAAVPAIFVQVR